ncbi:copper resistance protein NlpE [Parabacteroides sp. PF5-9]|uniref:copper resistance protein NlpE n=1 Tax=Parabacteroides sp. PF5-9 TaxID=1742404 RepID=UPI0024763C2B|nr:copper resistance protein NlpE [Parabacteroides sp. PF5-9]MDH6357561.1 putative lipoprotein NlpE involved in copper resistance [Parabacteroides sp. PF5-9]
MKKNIWSVLLCLGAVCAVLSACNNQKQPAVEVQAEAEPPQVVRDTHNSQNALDYEGLYVGTLPCADCSGIYTEITLSRDSFSMKQVYQGIEKENIAFEKSGKYSWNEQGSIITLGGDSAEQYQVGENKLFALDIQGHRITGDLAELYILTKK